MSRKRNIKEPSNGNEVALIQNDDSSSATDMLNYNCSIFPTNLNIIRFVPVEQSFQAKTVPAKIINKITTIFLISIFLSVIVYGGVYLYNFDRNNNIIVLRRHSDLSHNKKYLIIINKQLEELNEKLRILNKSLLEKAEPRNDIKSNESTNTTLNLLEYISTKIENALNVYDADKMAMIDYALESMGGSVVATPDTQIFSEYSYDIFGMVKIKGYSNPNKIIQPGIVPGQCIAFEGSRGKFRIRLAEKIFVTFVTMEHTHFNLVADKTTAPKDFAVYGLSNENGLDAEELGKFEFTTQKALQTFKVGDGNGTQMNYQFIDLFVLSNHGNLEYTCIYRFRVHGIKNKS